MALCLKHLKKVLHKILPQNNSGICCEAAALFGRMGRTPSNPELHELANRLSRIEYHGPMISKAPRFCHRHNGHIRVTRTIKYELVTLGITDNIAAAAFYSDCLTRLLHEYAFDTGTPISESVLNFTGYTANILAQENPLILLLAENVVGYLRSNGFLRNITDLINSRRITRLVLSDIDAKISEAQLSFRKLEEERARCAHSLSELYTL